MPPLLLDDDEAVAIAVGLRTAAGASVTGIEETSVRALVKLEQVLPAHLRRRVERAAVGHGDARRRPGPTVDPEVLTADRRRLPRPRARCASTTARRDGDASAAAGGAAQPRAPRPALVPAWPGTASARTGGRSASTAWSGRRAGGPRFDAARAPRAATRPPTSRRTSPAPRYRYQARVTLHAPAAEMSRRTAPLGRASSRSTSARCELRTSDDSLDWLAMRIGMLGVDFEVHEPPELVERFRALAGRLGRATG